ncbi:MAG: tRNA epoxyqueuosine(34) reductase QueG [Planctomycetes bacterium]|nr:tRNA epoxyqueuosine(34) reductase QueG [Planctomycetota bacterium]
MTLAEKTSLVKDLARKLGFDRVGVARPVPSARATYYRRWLADGYGGAMRYLHQNAELRENPARLLPGARAVICVALNYRRHDAPTSRTASIGRVAQYVRGHDYHRVLRAMLSELAAQLRQRLDEPFEQQVCVDTGAILERELAAAAGLGWIGKNTMLLHEGLGSYLFLGEVLTTLNLEPDIPAADRCGNCTRCLAACPTHALVAPYQLDASRCISYLTIEHRAKVPDEFHEQIGDWVFGCDICQQVCPYNRHAPLVTHPEIAADLIPAHLPLLDLLKLRSGDYRRLTKGTAATRASRNMWRRNAAIALGNSANLTEQEKQALANACEDDDPTVRHAARQATGRAT